MFSCETFGSRNISIFLENRFGEIFKTVRKPIVEKLESAKSWKSESIVIIYFS